MEMKAGFQADLYETSSKIPGSMINKNPLPCGGEGSE
jgi:hypothetical protein